MPRSADEESPLLSQDGRSTHPEGRSAVAFKEDDEENPKAWSRRKKLTNVGVIAFMALVSPLASSMFAPGIAQIAEDLDADPKLVIATTTGFVVMLGVGPLILAPLSETFGRRAIYISRFTIFSLLQIPTALSPNIAALVAFRTISGFFGSKPLFKSPHLDAANGSPVGVGIANGGGTISDMFDPSGRAAVFGWYLLGPLLGPTLGPLFGGIIVQRLNWRWIYWVLTIICSFNTVVGYFYLRETYAPVILAKRRSFLQERDGNTNEYYVEGEDKRPVSTKLLESLKRPYVIFVQPIVLTMSLYQAFIFGTTYSIYTNMQEIFSMMPYDFNSEQIGLLYLAPGLGFLTAVWFLVPRIDTVFNKLAEKNNGKALPEFRLPLANIGSVLIPVALFWFAWATEYRLNWFVTVFATYFYGIGQVMVFNCVQNYYIDAFAKYAASAIAAGAVFRSLLGGVVPLLAPALFQKLGYGWGISVFAFIGVAIAPSPLIFQYFGARIREKFKLEL